MAELPHEGVWARLAPSAIHGIGVFALKAIPAGTDVFANDRQPMMWVDAAEIGDLPQGSPARRLYEDFAVRRGSRWGCPANFNVMSVGWYVNEPLPDAAPNLTIAADLAMIACRDIAEGEEMTIDYRTFSA